MCHTCKACNSDAKGYTVGEANQGGYLGLVGPCLMLFNSKSPFVNTFSFDLKALIDLSNNNVGTNKLIVLVTVYTCNL